MAVLSSLPTDAKKMNRQDRQLKERVTTQVSPESCASQDVQLYVFC